jgi:spermidine synthase
MNNLSLNILGRAGLYFTVFLTGAAVMVVELLGTRIIAPFYGASLYVWSSLISVTMIALALGYFTGGRWADRAKRTGLSLIIALAALLILLIPWLIRPVLLATDPLGLRAGTFISALVLFSPSLTLLGMVGPFAIKLSTLKLEGVGTSVGSIYAVSTLGSVVGTLFLGFYLFPRVGSRQILIGLGIFLFLWAVAVALYEQKRLKLASIVVPPIALLAAIGIGLLQQAAGAGGASSSVYSGGGSFQILSERESLYGWVRVIDQPARNLRLLTADASIIGAASISRGENRLAYQDIVQLIPALAPPMKRALLLGQGAGHMAMVLRDRYEIATDTLEIDPAVADAATRYFGFTPTGQSIVGDARYEIRHLKGPYDLIIHDCFTGGSEPAYLLTVEALSQLRSLLSDQGILALNFVAFSEDGKNTALASIAKTLAQVFSRQLVFISEPGKDFNDFIFLVANHPINFNTRALTSEQIAWLEQRRLIVDKTRGVLLTDNFYPLNHLQIRKAKYYRHTLVGWLGADLLVR